MSKIIKIADLELLYVPKFTITKKKAKENKTMVTRIELNNGERIHFVTNHNQLQFRHTSSLGLGFVPGGRIRYFKHDEDPSHKFYIQALDVNYFESLDINTQKEFFTLSETKGDVSCSGKGFFKAMGIDAYIHAGSFDSDKMAQVMSDEGWIVEVDITSFINSM